MQSWFLEDTMSALEERTVLRTEFRLAVRLRPRVFQTRMDDRFMRNTRHDQKDKGSSETDQQLPLQDVLIMICLPTENSSKSSKLHIRQRRLE